MIIFSQEDVRFSWPVHDILAFVLSLFFRLVKHKWYFHNHPTSWASDRKQVLYESPIQHKIIVSSWSTPARIMNPYKIVHVEYYVQDCTRRVVARTSRSGGSDSSADGMLTPTPIHSTREAYSSCESFLSCPARLPNSCVRIYDLRSSGPRPRVVRT